MTYKLGNKMFLLSIISNTQYAFDDFDAIIVSTMSFFQFAKEKLQGFEITSINFILLLLTGDILLHFTSSVI
jgi:hypothetical protein